MGFKKQEIDKYSIRIGEEEYVMGPTSQSEDFADSPFFTVKVGNGIRGFSARADTYTFFGSDLQHLKLDTSSYPSAKALFKGEKGYFDECGAWLDSVYKLDEKNWIGWYHAEEKCNYANNGETHMSVAFSTSNDGGKTWVKPNYPQNQVITADKDLSNNVTTDDVGNPRVIKIDDYFYMFFWTDDWKIHVARSKISDHGKPGTWYKYYRGTFLEPGLDGHSSPTNSMYFPTYNTYLNRYLSINVSGKWGFFLKVSNSFTDIIKWESFPSNNIQKNIYPSVSYGDDPTVDHWFPHFNYDKQIYGYPSFISLDGNSDSIGKEFYIYYTKVFEKDDFSNRYILRRKITLEENKDSTNNIRIALISYEKQKPHKTKISTEIAKPSEGYIKDNVIGYVLSYSKKDFKPLYECYIPMWQDYMISTKDPSIYDWLHCEAYGDIFIRRIGWVSEKKTSEANVSLYRCFDEQDMNHFVARDSSCQGKRNDGLYGYIFSN